MCGAVFRKGSPPRLLLLPLLLLLGLIRLLLILHLNLRPPMRLRMHQVQSLTGQMELLDRRLMHQQARLKSGIQLQLWPWSQCRLQRMRMAMVLQSLLPV